MKNAVFSPQALLMLLICAVLLFSLSILLPALDNRPLATSSTFGPSSFSTSAIGHAGLYEVLKKLNRPVKRAVSDTLAQVGEKGALVLAEPDLRLFDEEDFLRLLKAPRVLVVLPKWRGVEHRRRPAWIDRAVQRPLADSQRLLGLVSNSAWVTRQYWPLSFTVNKLPFTPYGTGRVQLIRSDRLRPVVGTAEGMLVGEIIEGDRRIWVLSDPDIMANHGLGQGRNAAFMAALLDALRVGGPTAPLIFDETFHGFRAPEWSPATLLFQRPFVMVTGLVLASALLMLLAGIGRFGAARPSGQPLGYGKAGLIDNGARLLENAGHQGVTLKTYIRMTVYSTAMTLHAPGRLKDRALMEWLDRLGRARRVKESCADILHEMSETYAGGAGTMRLYQCARRIYTWKGEILNGSGTGRINR